MGCGKENRLARKLLVPPNEDVPLSWNQRMRYENRQALKSAASVALVMSILLGLMALTIFLFY